VRRLRPDAVFGADIIAGFPTETEAMFARSLDLIEECGIAHLHAFPYSPRRGTPAARMPQVPPPEVRARAERLRAAGAAALARHLVAEVGQIRQVLTEAPRMGRTEGFFEVALDADAPVGRILPVRIAGTVGTSLRACAP
jgi:threonylcarbamoyladenosine tRNA methylthiotransferase MtaB